MDTKLAMICGTDIPIPELQLTVHQPRLKEISLIGEQDFFTGVQCLCINKNLFVQAESDLESTTNFQIFLTIMSEKTAVDKKAAVQQVMMLLLPEYKVLFTPRAMVLQGPSAITIDESNFELLQDAIGLICCVKSGPMDQQTFNPADERAREIAQKLMRGRERVAKQKGTTESSTFSQYISTLTIGLGISLQELIELTMFQLYDLVERYMLYINWDLDIKSRLAGGKPEGQPENWMKDIH